MFLFCVLRNRLSLQFSIDVLKRISALNPCSAEHGTLNIKRVKSLITISVHKTLLCTEMQVYLGLKTFLFYSVYRLGNTTLCVGFIHRQFLIFVLGRIFSVCTRVNTQRKTFLYVITPIAFLSLLACAISHQIAEAVKLFQYVIS